jgi:hypothetical protein
VKALVGRWNLTGTVADPSSGPVAFTVTMACRQTALGGNARAEIDDDNRRELIDARGERNTRRQVTPRAYQMQLGVTF